MQEDAYEMWSLDVFKLAWWWSIFQLFCYICVYFIWSRLLPLASSGPPFMFLVLPFPYSYPVSPPLPPSYTSSLCIQLFHYLLFIHLLLIYFLFTYSFLIFFSIFHHLFPSWQNRNSKGHLFPIYKRGTHGSTPFYTKPTCPINIQTRCNTKRFLYWCKR
jgi:hypothetical protein